MAWVAITNNPNWEYDNAPADPGVGSPYRPLWLKQTSGVRTFKGHEVYTKVRRVGDSPTTNRGELSKTYWDNQ